ncbi:MAG: alpha/beta fold hydrolase [Leptolyngbya sp. Prado105]|jgi:pimeloyl-ACP methyl ester carboxylesterase|nr:alpha/beta fold hydrolase [Leptolyngbya sp. Prado105]
MFESFLPSEVSQLTEETSIALARQIRRAPIPTSISAEPIETAYVHQGEGGIPILLLHGFDSSVFEFRRLLPQLASQHETWMVDLLGFGFTDRPINVLFSPEAIKKHLYDFWQAKINQPVILVGASMGGAAAIDFALTYPETVAKLVLLDSAGFAAGPAIAKFLIPPLGYLATEFLRKPNVRRSVSLKAYSDSSFVSEDAELCAALHLKLSRWNEALIAFTQSGGYNFLRDKIAQIACPTLILWGDFDRILGTKDAARFESAIANSKLIWIKQCGHVPHLEKPEITAKHILEFVA